MNHTIDLTTMNKVMHDFLSDLLEEGKKYELVEPNESYLECDSRMTRKVQIHDPNHRYSFEVLWFVRINRVAVVNTSEDRQVWEGYLNGVTVGYELGAITVIKDYMKKIRENLPQRPESETARYGVIYADHIGDNSKIVWVEDKIVAGHLIETLKILDIDARLVTETTTVTTTYTKLGE